MHVVLIHNPRSGDDDHEGEQLVELLTRHGHRPTYFSSKSRWRPALEARPDLVVAAGGDGTVSEVARATAGTGIPVTILPTGTANNIAGFLGLSGIAHDTLVAGWTGASLRPFDLGIATGPWGTHRFVESIGIGLLAAMMSDIESGEGAHVNTLPNRETRISAALDVFDRVLRKAKPVRCEIQLDGETLAGEYLLVEVLNFGAAGPNLRLAPAADGADGLLDVVLIEAHERKRIENHLSTLATACSPVPALRAYHSRRVNLRCERCPLHLDDDVRSTQLTGGWAIDASIDAAAVTFLAPRVEAPGTAGMARARGAGPDISS